MTTSLLIENWWRLAMVIQERVELKMMEDNKALPASEIDEFLKQIVPVVD